MFHFRGKNNGWIITSRLFYLPCDGWIMTSRLFYLPCDGWIITSRLFYLPCDGYTHGITIDVYITDINVSDEKSLGICQ